MCIERWAREKSFDLAGASVAIQGFGNVGAHLSMTLSRMGVVLVAVGYHTGYWRNPDGFNPYRLFEHVRSEGALAGQGRGEEIGRDARHRPATAHNGPTLSLSKTSRNKRLRH